MIDAVMYGMMPSANTGDTGEAAAREGVDESDASFRWIDSMNSMQERPGRRPGSG